MRARKKIRGKIIAAQKARFKKAGRFRASSEILF